MKKELLVRDGEKLVIGMSCKTLRGKEGEGRIGGLQFGRAVFGFLGSLLVADLADVPHVDATVVAGAGYDGIVVRVPLEADDAVAVALERVQLGVQAAQVPDADGMVCRTGGDDVLELWVPGNAVDSIRVGIVLGVPSLGRAFHARVNDVKGAVV